MGAFYQFNKTGRQIGLITGLGDTYTGVSHVYGDYYYVVIKETTAFAESVWYVKIDFKNSAIRFIKQLKRNTAQQTVYRQITRDNHRVYFSQQKVLIGSSRYDVKHIDKNGNVIDTPVKNQLTIQRGVTHRNWYGGVITRGGSSSRWTLSYSYGNRLKGYANTGVTDGRDQTYDGRNIWFLRATTSGNLQNVNWNNRLYDAITLSGTITPTGITTNGKDFNQYAIR